MHIHVIPKAHKDGAGKQLSHVAVNGQAFAIDLEGIESEFSKDERVLGIVWDGRDGIIQRKSRIASKVDTEHFEDVSLLDPYVKAWQDERHYRDAHVDNAVHDQGVAEAKRKEQEAENEAKRPLLEFAQALHARKQVCDTVAMRAIKNNDLYPDEWAAYEKKLVDLATSPPENLAGIDLATFAWPEQPQVPEWAL